MVLGHSCKEALKLLLRAPLRAITPRSWLYPLYLLATLHIFRFSPSFDTDRFNGEHTINEAFRADSLNEGVRFYTKFILNVDESDLL